MMGQAAPAPATPAAPAVNVSDDARTTTYYDRPVVKEPVWIWAVPAYFFVGGAAGAAATIGAAAQVVGGEDLRVLSEKCRWIAAAGTSVGGALLVYDLGRPERFYNMLRVFRPTSAMNMGSWILTAAGGTCAAAAVLSRSDDRAGKIGDGAALAAGLTGLPLATYTAVLLADTSMPIWQQLRTTMPFLFAASAAASAGSLLKFFELGEVGDRAAWAFGLAGGIAELAASAAVERQAAVVERVGRPLRGGLSGLLWKTARAFTAGGVVLALAPRRSKAARVASAICGAGGSLALRFAIFHAGKASARDPRATFEQQRAGLGGHEVTGVAAVSGPSS